MSTIQYDSYVIHKVRKSTTIHRECLISTIATELK